MDIIAVFDIGKTNKKFLLFNEDLQLIHEEDIRFDEVPDEEGFPGDDIVLIEIWMQKCIDNAFNSGIFKLSAVNFSTYGASLMYVDKSGNRLTPLINYLKPMPEGVLDGFYEQYGGIEEFSRRTGSPALGMLNSGLQSLWLKRMKPEVFAKVAAVLHFPQYLSYFFANQLVSEVTSIGAHTTFWDFDNNCYHQWVTDEHIPVPDPIASSTAFRIIIRNEFIHVGVGLHDSSSSLVPYLKGSEKKFLMISTGTWCVFMNPFNNEPLTTEQLRKGALYFMSINQQRVKSSLLILGLIHDMNIERISKYFGVEQGYYKKIMIDNVKLASFRDNHTKIFFRDGVPKDYVDVMIDYGRFISFDEAYNQFMGDLVTLAIETCALVLPENDQTEVVYISGGFAKNELFTRFIAACFPDKEVYTSEINNASALGAALTIRENVFNGKAMPSIDLGLSRVH